jgi:hypothetical protein
MIFQSRILPPILGKFGIRIMVVLGLAFFAPVGSSTCASVQRAPEAASRSRSCYAEPGQRFAMMPLLDRSEFSARDRIFPRHRRSR